MLLPLYTVNAAVANTWQPPPSDAVAVMIAVSDDQERLARENLFKPLQEFAVVMGGHPLPANILLDIGRVAQIAPIRRKFGTQALVPREMIGDGIDINEKRAIAALALDKLGSSVEVKAIRLEITGAKVDHVQVVRDAGRRLESTRV